MTISLVLAAVLSTANFPDALATLSQGPAPACTVCHQGQPMRGTVTTPFGTALRQRGLQAGDEASLRAAFIALGSADSDADGTTDVDELKAGKDPNVPAQQDSAPLPVPEYGCATSPALSVWFLVPLIWSLQRRISSVPHARSRKAFQTTEA